MRLVLSWPQSYSQGVTKAVHRQDHDPHRLRRLRREAGMTIRELADRSGVAKSTITRAENPNEGGLSPTTLRGIAAALGLEIKDLMRRNGQRKN